MISLVSNPSSAAAGVSPIRGQIRRGRGLCTSARKLSGDTSTSNEDTILPQNQRNFILLASPSHPSSSGI
jgi:hypothetical protein